MKNGKVEFLSEVGVWVGEGLHGLFVLTSCESLG